MVAEWVGGAPGSQSFRLQGALGAGSKQIFRDRDEAKADLGGEAGRKDPEGNRSQGALGPVHTGSCAPQGAVHHRVQNSGTQIQFQP